VKQNVGTIREVGDGVARVDGLSDVMLNEMLDLGHGITGIALSLEETDVGVIILGDDTRLQEGGEVRATGKLLQVPVGKGLLGRVVNTLGEPIDAKGPIASDAAYPVEKIAPGIMRRRPIGQPVQTGIMAVDAMIPIGRGQRELIIGDRSTGKTTICIDTIISQARLNSAAEAAGDKDYRPLYCIYVAIGQKQSTIARIISVLDATGALPYTIVVVASAADSATSQYLAPFAGAAMGEWFMDHGMDALIVYDDLSKHAVAYRQVSLVLKRPSGREAYPGDVFYLHSRLLERAARVGEQYGNGSLTALPIIETQAGDVSAYIPTNVISITDGQIFLETDLFYQGIRPAISVGISVSRVGSAAQLKAMKQVAGRLKGDLAQFRELAAFAQFGSELDAATQAKIDRGKRIIELFNQPQHDPIPVEIQVALLWAVQNGYLDGVPLDRVKDYQNRLVDYLNTSKAALLSKILTQKTIDDALTADLRAAADQFKLMWA
jgi:F-type H+-transporting ATPase subunit alpha